MHSLASPRTTGHRKLTEALEHLRSLEAAREHQTLVLRPPNKKEKKNQTTNKTKINHLTMKRTNKVSAQLHSHFSPLVY